MVNVIILIFFIVGAYLFLELIDDLRHKIHGKENCKKFDEEWMDK
jgi:hypothetical protein